jgi:ssDNA-binding Zn-finger/Zn-ribbon topoisomerase 1
MNDPIRLDLRKSRLYKLSEIRKSSKQCPNCHANLVSRGRKRKLNSHNKQGPYCWDYRCPVCEYYMVILDDVV